MNDEVKKIRTALSVFSFIVHRSSFIVFLFLLPGCSLLGALAYKSGVGRQEPAQFAPDKLAPMVVVTENWSNPADSDVETEQLARFIYQELKDNKVAPQIDPMGVIDLRSQDPQKFRTMSIPQIGKWAGAKQVLYVNITDNVLDAPIGSEVVTGGCTARVKIVNVDTGQIIWPPDVARGYPVTVKTPTVQEGGATDEASVRQSLEKLIAGRIVRLFYKHDEEEDEAGADEMQ